MYIFPAIDLYEKKAVRLLRGEYDKMTVYSDEPDKLAKEFEKAGASFVHIVDLEGAKDGTCPNMDIIKKIVEGTSLFVEVGGGIRSEKTAKAYLDSGVDRVILGTAAVKDEELLINLVRKYGEKIAVGADIKDGFVSIKGWTENSEYTLFAFLEKMQKIGVKTVIVTDISKDGAMSGTNRQMYKEISEKYSIDIVASGGVSSIEDVCALSDMGMYAAIIGKAYYTGAIDLREAVIKAEGRVGL